MSRLTRIQYNVLVWFAFVVVVVFSAAASAQESQFVESPWYKQSMISGPSCMGYSGASWTACDATTHENWLADVRRWRDERRIRIGFSDARYLDPRVGWARGAFMQAQAMVEDRFLYDPAAGRYTVDRYLKDLAARFGGIDAVLIWPSYPNMGVDDRNQIDMLRAMPGGIEGVAGMVADFHRHGVRVLFPFMMWDQGTRDPGTPWAEALASLMAEVGADGMNGDTQDGVSLHFSQAADATGHPLVFQPEGPPHDEALAWNVMSWGQYSFDFIPKVDRFRWLEPFHMVNISDRWSRSKTDDLQYAFFNGEGWETWENIWGIWNGIAPRDGEATRRVSAIERKMGAFLNSPDWEPFYPTTQFGVFAGRWPNSDQTLWTVVNRNEYSVDGAQFKALAKNGARWFDLYHGVELTPVAQDGQVILTFPIEAKGYGAVLEVKGSPEAWLSDFLATMHAMTAKPLAAYDDSWTSLPQMSVPIAATSPYATAPGGMVAIPAARFDFKVRGIEIEGDDQVGVDVAYPWEPTARRFHDHLIEIQAFFIDVTPVTNRQFQSFLVAARYEPRDAANFLKGWDGSVYPDGAADHPATWVSLEDARAYCAWAGKRLPHEWEWQYAAQGTDGRAYPWGDSWRANATPAPDKGRTMIAPDPVGAHPASASPFGVLDLVGNVWQWTDEFQDEHTRAAILRGGSFYQPSGSVWYFPQAYRNDQHGKLLLMAPGRDRSSAIGFRCVADAK